ncbi:MAG: efflux RND transporter periplasmic adaptor subunit [Desulfamplus sp.]|nr:efflux RND transporter periplasmic adaptor subunit [Desulfamplus sp.]
MQVFTLIIFSFVCHPAAYPQGPPPARVIVGKVTMEEVAATRSSTGVIYYDRVSDISTEIAGLVETVTVTQGDHVKKGDPLVHLNTEILEKEIALTRTRMEQIDLLILHTEKNYRRLERLFSKSVTSEKEYEDAFYSYQDAKMEKQAVADTLGKLLIQKKRAVIKAPFDGVVLNKNVDSGAWVQQGKLLVSIGSDKDIFVRVPVAETVLKYIKTGDTVPVILTAHDREVEGTFMGMEPVADLKTKNIFLKVKIPPMERVAENMSVTVFVPGSKKRSLAVMNREALVKFQGRDFIYTVKDGKALMMPVSIAAYLGNRVAVDDPHIVPGIQVVVEGNERLRPDQPVVVAGEK